MPMSAAPCRGKPGLHPLLDQRPFELRQRAEMWNRNSPCGVVVSICSVSVHGPAETAT